MMKAITRLPAIALLSTVMLLGFANASSAETLRTKNFDVTIRKNCLEGTVTCNNVQYRGVNIRTGESIRLTGRTLNATCADGVTPCRFLGYEFRNNNYRYVVTEGGSLQVYQGNRLLLKEQGTWQY